MAATMPDELFLTLLNAAPILVASGVSAFAIPKRLAAFTVTALGLGAGLAAWGAGILSAPQANALALAIMASGSLYGAGREATRLARNASGDRWPVPPPDPTMPAVEPEDWEAEEDDDVWPEDGSKKRRPAARANDKTKRGNQR